MASSLEELLAEDGFRGKKSTTRSRASFGSDNVTTPLYRSRGQHKPESSSGNQARTQRTRSDASRYSLNGRLGKSDSIGGRRPRDNMVTKERTKGKGTEVLEGRLSVERPRDGRSEVSSDALSRDEIVEVGVEKDERIKDMYLSEGKRALKVDKFPTLSDGRNKSMGKDMESDRRDPSSSQKHLLRDPSSTRSERTSMKQAEPSEDRHLQKHVHMLFDSLPALDEVAIRATISILTGYIIPFRKDKDFRVGLHDKCYSFLNFVESEKYQSGESKVILNLAQAIETVERAAEEYADTKDLKRASLQLSVITGLNTGKLKDGLTCGVPNSKLSACAHLYLSVLYKIQKKDRVSAKHILQIFADSPLEGRTFLLPELWENFFYPHLSHLKLWHSQEVDSLVDVTSKGRNLKLLNKVYNEILDLGTCQFAVYYKDWLTEGAEAPPFPSINVPSVSVQTVELSDSLNHSGELGNPVSAPYPQPMVSKKLYEAVFGRSNKPGAADDEGGQNCRKSSDGSSVECNETLTYSYETVKHMDQHSIATSTKHLGDEELSVVEAKSSLQVSCRSDEYSDEGSSTVPQYLICPLTGQLFEDPVTLETGQTFERTAIRKWFDEGNKSCPVTGTSLEHLGVPLTNMVIRCVIDSWKSKHCRSILAFASQMMAETEGHQLVHSDDGSISILEQLITMYSKGERVANAKHLLYLGGMQYLIRRFNVGTIEVKMRAIALLLCCIEADSSCRDQIAKAINIEVLLELLHSKQIEARTNAVSLLTELICLNRRKDVADILSALPKEEMVNAMHILLLYLRTSPSQERPMVAVLLLKLDLLVGPQKYSIYRDGAVDAIALALDLTLTNEDVKETCCKALSILGDCFLLSGKLTGAGLDVSEANLEENKECGLPRDHGILFGDEEPVLERWLRYLLASLIGNEKKPFLEAMLKCLASGESNLVLACLKTVAWLSFALPSQLEAGFQLSAFSALICQLKENLQSGEEEHKMLASFCLLNFSKISECRVLLMTIAKEIVAHLRSIANVSWTAKELYSIISEEDL